MKLKVIRAGISTSIQDQGRTGFRDIGVPVSGSMDHFASRMANLLVGNKMSSPILEVTYGDVYLKTETDVLISFTGSGCSVFAGETELAFWKTLFVPAGIELKMLPAEKGCRTYVGIAGGWLAQYVMNSASTYAPIGIGGLDGRLIQAGDILSAEPKLSVISMTMISKLSVGRINSFHWGIYPNSLVNYQSKQIRVMIHHEFDWFDPFAQEAFFKDEFKLNIQSNRMGYRLDGEPLGQTSAKQLLSTSVSMGTIQVTLSGMMILLMADCQTTGGYPRIAQVAAVDLPVCAQLKPGDKISFKQISMEEAERAFISLEKDISCLARGIIDRVVAQNLKFVSND
ncbi:MAG: biotin-dependent carboxyltransferase family protein [Chitinophagaceae bacterium]|nr:MAG: biotin-dependent carboxyltransferase family protein [Chitinophagaceae bacterium]